MFYGKIDVELIIGELILILAENYHQIFSALQ